MTNRQPRIDTDSDDRIENANLDFAQNLNQSDTLTAYPLAAADLDLSMAPTWTGAHVFDAGMTTDGLTVRQGRGLLGLPNHHVNYAANLSDEELARFTLAAGDVLELWYLEVQLKGGGTDGNVSLDVRDVDGSSTLGSTTAGSANRGGSSPIGTSSSGATIIVRLSTGGSSVDITTTGVTSVVSS